MYGIRKGQIWKSNSSYYGDLKILGVLPKSKTGQVCVLDLKYDVCRSFNGYTIARLGLFQLHKDVPIERDPEILKAIQEKRRNKRYSIIRTITPHDKIMELAEI